MTRPYAVIPLPADASLVAAVLEACSRSHHRATRRTLPFAAVRQTSGYGVGPCIVIEEARTETHCGPGCDEHHRYDDGCLLGPLRDEKTLREAIEQVHAAAEKSMSPRAVNVVTDGPPRTEHVPVPVDPRRGRRL